MIAKTLTTKNFRNLKDICFTPCPNVNVLYGDNAQGKTNIIEALWLFSGVRSFRSSKDFELITFDHQDCKLSLDFNAQSIDNDATISIGEKKTLYLNGIKYDRTTALAGKFCEVVFSPDHLNLIKQGPIQRRKFIDYAITEILPSYGSSLLEYNKVLKQRNALLKDIQKNKSLADMLPVWDEKLVKIGAQIVFTRLRYLVRLSAHAKTIYSGIAKNKEELLEIKYIADGNINLPEDIKHAKIFIPQLRELLLKAIQNSLVDDIASGHTKIGPHHDDILITIGGVNSRLFASQGQQRSAVLSLKLAESKVLTETIGETPVLLLDDVMSELDPTRQNYILNNIGSSQVFITCCDPSSLETLEGGKIFELKSGEITEK